jgi:transposase InsO family protein
MTIAMPKNVREERYRWIKPILDGDMTQKDIAKLCPHSGRSLRRWCALFRAKGLAGLDPVSTKPKGHPDDTLIRIKERVIEIRKATQKCALKIKWQLAKEGIVIHERTVGKILKAEGLTRKYRVKKIPYKYIRALRKPGELVEIDVKYVPGRIAGKRYFQYTAIDCASRWRYLKVFDEQTGWNSSLFLLEMIHRFPHPIQAVKTDNGFIFTNRYTGTYKRIDLLPKGIHAFDQFCNERHIVHYLIDPGKPAQNGTVERSHREDQEKFYEQNKFKTIAELERKIELWNIYYNNLEHCSLNGKTPNEMLELFKRTNVCT